MESHYFNLIRKWGLEKGIPIKGDPKSQALKAMEELGELTHAILKDDKIEISDAIGDTVIVLTNLATMYNMKIEDCIKDSYNVVSKRSGNMINGTFVKNKK
jgi:NTP pyrophosphatase (non-canonical NTP hydrolase)